MFEVIKFFREAIPTESRWLFALFCAIGGGILGGIGGWIVDAGYKNSLAEKVAQAQRNVDDPGDVPSTRVEGAAQSPSIDREVGPLPASNTPSGHTGADVARPADLSAALRILLKSGLG